MNTFLTGRGGGTGANKEATGETVGENDGAVGVKKRVLGAARCHGHTRMFRNRGPTSPHDELVFWLRLNHV